MSASFVTDNCINSLVSLAFYGPSDYEVTWYEEGEFYWSMALEPTDDDYRILVETAVDPTHRTPQQLGQILRQANDHSVAAHWRQATLDPERAAEVINYSFTPLVSPTALEAFTLINHYEYHTNEANDWLYSEARVVCSALKERIQDQLCRDVSYDPDLAKPRSDSIRQGLLEMEAYGKELEAAWERQQKYDPDSLDICGQSTLS
jgi:hypothetical protein